MKNALFAISTFFVLVFSEPVSLRATDKYFVSTELLGRPASNSVSLELIPEVDMKLYVEFGEKSGKYTGRTATVQGKADETVEIVIDKLKKDTKYYYRVRFKTDGANTYQARDEYSFHTQRKKTSEFNFAVISDPHLDQKQNIIQFKQTLENIRSKEPDFLIDLGDTFMTDWLDSYSIASITSRMLTVREYYANICHSVPFFFALGNHEGEKGFAMRGNRRNLAKNAITLRKMYLPNPYPDSFFTGNSTREDGIVYQLVPQPARIRKTQQPEASEHGYKSGTILNGVGHLKVTVNKQLVKVDFIEPDDSSGNKSTNGNVLHSYKINSK